MFLDQFSGDELSELARQLEPAQSETLIEYARDAAETEDDSTDKIFSLLTSARDIRETRQAAAENVGSQLDDFAAGSGLGGLADEIRLSLKPDSIETHGREVLRGIFASVNRPERFARLLRIWGGRVVQHLRQQEYGRAIDVVEIVRKDPPYDPGFEESVVGAVARLVTRPLLDGVVAAMDTDDRDVSIRFLATLGPPATRRLIEVLADEQDGSRRRPLIDLLTVLGREDPKPLLSSLSDPRWYVVRNVASVLGKAGSSAAVKPLKRVLHHDDGRVRVEVLRALQPLAPEDAPQLLVEALRDEDERVRHAAVTLIRASKAEGIDGDLVTAFESGELDEQTMNKLAQVLAQSGSPLAREALEAAAGKKLALKGGDRTARNAARAALNRGAS
jgi:HEAT repeat protein